MSRRWFDIRMASEVNSSGRTVYRAELWAQPFSVYMVACTRWCITRTWARRCAHVFRVDVKL